jgi:hypothetical protein
MNHRISGKYKICPQHKELALGEVDDSGASVKNRQSNAEKTVDAAQYDAAQ